MSAILLTISCGEQRGQVSEVSPTEETATRELVFSDSIGVEFGDSNYVLGSIEAVSHSIDGNILLLDRPACCVLEYASGGEFVRRLGRRGTGPGEFVNPVSMTRLTDGRIAALDMQTGGLHTFTPDGQWEGISAQITNEPVLWITPADNDRYIGSMNSFEVVAKN